MKTTEQLNADTLFAFQMALKGHKQFEYQHEGRWLRTFDVSSIAPRRIYHDIPEGWTRHDGEDWKGDNQVWLEAVMWCDGRTDLNERSASSLIVGMENYFTNHEPQRRIYAYKLKAAWKLGNEVNGHNLPDGEKWSTPLRKKWTEEMLTGGYRPLTESEWKLLPLDTQRFHPSNGWEESAFIGQKLPPQNQHDDFYRTRSPIPKLSPAIPEGFTAHDGGTIPVHADAEVEAIRLRGTPYKGIAKHLCWTDIIAYRVIEKKVIPWTFADTPMNAKVKRKSDSDEVFRMSAYPDKVGLYPTSFAMDGERVTYETLATDYLQLDGSVCGKEENK